MAQELQRQLASEGNGYRRKGTLWDFQALYGRQAKWGESLPVFTGGPVAFTTAALEEKLAAFSSSIVTH